MNPKLILGLGATGFAPPLIALLLRAGPVVSAILWTALAALVWVPVVLRAREPRPFLALVLVGLVAGVAAGAVDAGATGDPMLFVMALSIGLAWGALFGAIAAGIRSFRAPA